MSLLAAMPLKTAGLLAGGAVLILGSTYGLGYWKGVRKAGAAPVATATTTDRTGEKERQQQKVIVSNIYANEDTLETRLTLPEIIMPDGSRRAQTRITREAVTKQAEEKAESAKIQYVDRVVEKKVAVPCPTAEAPLVSPLAPPLTPQPRFLVGPSVGRNFKLDRTVFGGGAAVRVGSGWLRIAGDSDPSASVAVELQF